MEGRRLEKSSSQPNKIKWGLIAAALVAVAAVSGYLGLCSWVGSSPKILPNVSIAGVDVSNMTQDQARTAVEQAVERYGGGATATLRCGDWSGTVSCAELQRDDGVCAALAMHVGRGSFPTRGFEYLRHLTGLASSSVPLAAGSLHLAQPALDKLLEKADREIGGGIRSYGWTVGEDQVVLTKGRTGTSFDRDMVVRLAAQAADRALAAAIAQNGSADEQVDLSACEGAMTSSPPEAPDLQALHQAVYVQAKDAAMDPETYEITDHVVGMDFDMNALQAAYDAAAEGETVSVPLTVTQPAETRESLTGKLFQDVLGQATTKVSGTANRKTNVKMAAGACNGKILLPGEIFSYNETTGPRDESTGYLPGNAYISGQTVLTAGGGVCQGSSTIYYAVLHSTLEVVERYYHEFAVGYVPDGMDATVFYDSVDFRFRNNTDYPVKIVTEFYEKNGSSYLTATLYGTNPSGRYGVPKNEVYDWASPTDRYVADESVPQGTLVLDREQNAYSGRSARTYRYIYDKDGNLLEKQEMEKSKYKMRPNLYHYNPADGDPSTWVDGKPPIPAPAPEPGEEPVPVQPQLPGENDPPGSAVPPVTEPSPEPAPEPIPEPTPDGDQPAPEGGLGEGEATPV